MQQGIDLMREASRLDPAYAPAQAELALCLQYSAFFNYVLPLDVYEESKAAAQRAVELDEQLAEAHVAMAGVLYYLEFDRAGAELQLQRALELNPGSVKALIHSSWLLGESGRFEDALPPTLKAIELDPLNTSANHALGQIYLLARDFDAAIEAFDKALALDRGDPVLVAWPGLGLCGARRVTACPGTEPNRGGAFRAGSAVCLATRVHPCPDGQPR